MITGIAKLAKYALADVDKAKVLGLLEAVNLTAQERTIVEKTELEGKRLYDMAELFCLSQDSVALIKSRALRKIGVYLTQKLQ